MSAHRAPGEGPPSEFARALAGAKPIAEADKARPPAKTLRRRKPREEPERAGFEIERLGEHVEGSAPGIDRAILRRLRNGEIPRDARLDLHGLHAGAARERVRETLLHVHGAGGRCVLVIHGRGHRSPAEPVLKEALLEWLTEPPLGALVMAFTSATGGDGGVGATYVLLRRDR